MAAIGGTDQLHLRELEKETEPDAVACTDDSEDDSDDGSDNDSVDDPSFDIVEETRSAFSAISIKNPRSRGSGKCKDDHANLETEEGIEDLGSSVPKLDEKDEKTFEKVEELIKGGDLEKLKIDQCKIYLRKYGLRLTGTKSILISRITEHLEIIDGGGEKKYPPESFVLNCKGDACLGDVVIFEQNVYEMFSIASRSATGPSCGTRTVAGRIVKESYGAAKQQHTFTIEVLWSRGMKPWPPLHQLLIKGRNLYRIKTMRQRWDDEGKRQKVLQEKHARGFVARYSRDVRVEEKERRRHGLVVNRKNFTKNSMGDKENHHPQRPRFQQISKNKEKQQNQHEMRTNSATSATNQQTRNAPPSLGKPMPAYRVSECDTRTQIGATQAPNPMNNMHSNPIVDRHHSQHHDRQSQQFSKNKEKQQNQHEIRTNSATNQQPMTAYRVSECGFRAQIGASQAPNPPNNWYANPNVRHHHNHQHHNHPHWSQHDHRHHYYMNSCFHQTLSATHPIHPMQQHPPVQERFPGFQKRQ